MIPSTRHDCLTTLRGTSRPPFLTLFIRPTAHCYLGPSPMARSPLPSRWTSEPSSGLALLSFLRELWATSGPLSRKHCWSGGLVCKLADFRIFLDALDDDATF